jgi:hypothetical protein
LREERRFRVFENRVLRRFGPERDKVTGEWRTLCCVLLAIYHSGDQVKKKEMSKSCCSYGRDEIFVQGFSGET